MFFRKQLWRAVIASTAIGMGVALLAPAHAAADSGKKPKTAARHSAKPLPKSSAKSRHRSQKAATAAVAVAATSVTAPKLHSKPIPSQAEARLLSVIELIERQQLDAALQAAAQLTADVPNFQAAQLVYADLLRFRTGKPGLLTSPTPPPLPTVAHPPPAAGTQAPFKEVLVKYNAPSPAAASTAPNANAQDWQSQLQGLRDELRRRVQSASTLPPAGSVPREFLQLGASVRHALAIDASKSRLYLFSNEDGKLRLTADYYISVGKLGTGKALEGDQRTPEGIYFIGRQIPGAKLPDFYGKGALTVNYPNDWDKSVGRSGDGIWLHGSPPDQFARLPEASDGCVVLANPDLISLMRTVDRQTPVLIRDKMQWTAQPEKTAAPASDAFLRVMDTWQQAWKSADQQALAKLYSPAPLAENVSRNRISEYFQRSEAAMKDVSVYAWKDTKGEIRIVDLQVGGKRASKPLSLRQYWRKAGDRWEIFSESVRG